MKYSELSKSSAKELVAQDKELRAELFQLRLKNKTAQLEKKGKIKAVRRDIARVQTKLSELKNSEAKS